MNQPGTPGGRIVRGKSGGSCKGSVFDTIKPEIARNGWQGDDKPGFIPRCAGGRQAGKGGFGFLRYAGKLFGIGAF